LKIENDVFVNEPKPTKLFETFCKTFFKFFKFVLRDIVTKKVCQKSILGDAFSLKYEPLTIPQKVMYFGNVMFTI
jgi:hypothetical protein